MIVEKIRFITQDIPGIESKIATLNSSLKSLLSKEKGLATKIAKSDTFKDLENIITELNENYRRKGEIDDVDNTVAILEEELHEIDQGVFSEEFKERINEQLVKFNKIFSKVSDDLYGEKYGISFDIKVDKKTGKSIYI